VEEKTMPSEAFGLTLDGAGRDPELAGDLAESGTGDEAEKEGLEEVGALEPVGGGEGLCTEVAATVMTEIPLDALGALVSEVEALLLESPRLRS
jgi:hypothetical protein